MFNIYLFSDASSKQFKDNTPSRFTVQLPETYTLHNYECAVIDVTLPNRILNIRDNLFYMKTSLIEVDDYFRSGYYDTVDQLLHVLHYKMVREMVYEEEKERSVKPYAEYKDGRVTFQLRPPVEEVRLYGDLANLLGFDIVTGGHVAVTGIKPITSDRVVPPIFEGTSRPVFIYSNITREQCVGSVSTPLLRIVDLSGATIDDYTHRIYENPQYTPLQSETFSSIELQLRDELGDLIPFNDGVSRVVLSFRPIDAI